MKMACTKFGFLLMMLVMFGCSDDDGPKDVSGTIEFSTIGVHSFNINANNIKANITIVSGGGGGGGGVGSNALNNSTGGGGGGGAGELKVLTDITLMGNEDYTATIGAGGLGGNVGSAGTNGQVSGISLDQIILYTSSLGNGGSSNTLNSMSGGFGGSGFTAGIAGGNGEVVDGIGNATAGTGGNGGSNSTNYGSGGKGGDGQGYDVAFPLEAHAGNNGSSGYIKIEWTGTN